MIVPCDHQYCNDPSVDQTYQTSPRFITDILGHALYPFPRLGFSSDIGLLRDQAKGDISALG